MKERDKTHVGMTVHNETETGYGVTGPLTWASGKASVLAGGGYEVLPEQ